MKIRVPKYALEHNLNDHELVFSCFMGYVGKQGAKTTNASIEEINIRELQFNPNLAFGYQKRTELEPHPPCPLAGNFLAWWNRDY